MIIIDVREPDEYNENHVSGALNLPLNHISETNPKIKSISKNEELIVYCRSGARAERARHLLIDMGYKNTQNGINQEVTESNL